MLLCFVPFPAERASNFRQTFMRNAEAPSELKNSSPAYEPISGSGRGADSVISTCCGWITIHRSHGRGMPVLFLNGEPSYRETFVDLIFSDLGADYKLIAIDCSATNNTINRTSELADAALRVIEDFDIDYAAVVGHSFGCLIAVELAAYFHGVTAIGLSGLPAPRSIKALGEDDDVEATDRIIKPEIGCFTEISTVCPEKCYVLDDVKEDLNVFLKRADALYKRTIAEPLLWYGG